MISRLKNSSHFKNISVLVSGTVASQLILVGSSVLLTRLYDGEQFGVYGSLMSVATILSVVVTLRYEIPIALESRWKNSIALFRLSSIISLLLLGLFLLPSLLLPNSIVRLFSWELPPEALYLAAVLGFAMGFYGVLDFLLVRNGQFRLLSLANVVKAIAMVVAQVSFSFLLGDFYGLIYGQIVGILIATCVAILNLRHKRVIFCNPLSISFLRKLAAKHRNFPKFNLPQSFINAVSQNIPTLLLASLFDVETAGYYWFTTRILRIPAMTVGAAIRKVFYKRTTDIGIDNRKGYYAEFKKTTTIMSLLGVLITVPLVLFAADLFSIFFGQEWYIAGKYGSFLSPSIVLSALVNIPSVVTIQAYSKQKVHLVLEVGLTLFRILALYIGYLEDSAMISIICFSAVGIIFNAVLVIYSFKLLRIPNEK